MSAPPTITLHWLEKSRAQRVLWLLEELHVPHEIKTYKRDPKTMVADPQLKSIHPLGKAPVLTVGGLALAESALIVEYLCEHFGGRDGAPSLIPAKWKPGAEGMLGGETDEYMRYRYYMHYAEGSLFSLLFTFILTNNIKSAPVPFFLKPVTSSIAGKINSGYVHPNFVTHLQFLEDQLASAPGGGPYLCGPSLTGADIMVSFPIIVLTSGGDLAPPNFSKKTHPRLFAYAQKLQESEGYKRAVEKIVAIEGEYSLI